MRTLVKWQEWAVLISICRLGGDAFEVGSEPVLTNSASYTNVCDVLPAVAYQVSLKRQLWAVCRFCKSVFGGTLS